MALVRKVSVILFDDHNAEEAVVVAVYSWGSVCVLKDFYFGDYSYLGQ